MEDYGPGSYGDAFADVYDDWYHDVSDVEATVTCLQRLAGDGRVLELGIGTGRLALPLAARGVPVSGVDASEAMVAELRKKPGGDTVDVLVADMSEDLPPGPFRVVFAAFNTLFNLQTEAAQTRCLGLAAARLDGHGFVVVEAFVPDDGLPAERGRVEVRRATADRVVLSVSQVEPHEHRAGGQFVDVRADGSVRVRPWAVRYATPGELDAMAAAAGLVLAERWADWRHTPFDRHSAQHVSVYRRVRGSAT
jgi:SAM-dependent methyltransferase